MVTEALRPNGKERYTAYYRDARGKACVAGTFARKRDADQAWKTAEVRLAEGRLGDPRRGRQTFQRYVEEEWLPHHVMEATTREGYTYSIYKHIMPWFGPMRMNQIMPADVREWVTHPTNNQDPPVEPPHPQEHPQRGLHHRSERPGHIPAPV